VILVSEHNNQELKQLIFDMCAVPTVSGFERRATERIRQIVGDRMEFVSSDGVGNVLFVKRCGREGAPKILIDAHLDEIGMIVREVCDGGFLRVAPMGGIDPAIMQASDVIIYGKQELRGVVVSTPPHLRSGEGELPDIDKLLIDTGLSKEKAVELIPLGTPVGFAPVYSEMLNERIVGKSFDDKACAACALAGIASVDAKALAGDVYLLLSAIEETNRLGGAAAATFSLLPDYAMVVDVNLARVPNTQKSETVEMDKGISISVSAATHVALTRATQKLCEDKGIEHSMVAAPSSTGTNATSVNLTAYGVPTVDIGLPLASMHTYCEVISLRDCRTLSELVAQFVCSGEIAEQMRCGEVDIL
jgi:endoglucanase